LVDLALLNAAYLAASGVKFGSLAGAYSPPYLELWWWSMGAWVAATFVLDTYAEIRFHSYRRLAKTLVQTLLLYLLLVAGFWVARKAYYYSREQLALTFGIFAALALAWRVARIAIRRSRYRRGIGLRRVAVIGGGEVAQAICALFESKPALGFQVVGIFHAKPSISLPSLPLWAGEIDDAPIRIPALEVEELYLAEPMLDSALVHQLLDFAERQLIRIRILPDFQGFGAENFRLEMYGGVPVLQLNEHPLEDGLNLAIKRAFDVLVALVFMVLIGSWLFPILAVAVRLSSPGPVFFKQKRAGRGGEVFLCWKFRTMFVQPPGEFIQARSGDTRITKLGALLRRTSLDELPQVLNVLTGAMSVVGPRPHPLPLNEQFQDYVTKYQARHLVKPGITGLAQARGYRGETAGVQKMAHRVKLDRFYVANWSLLLDIKIILMTVVALARGQQDAV
jgi:putative colanic acid biosysnthesis UDP-glucose lipid carrier transferase